MAVVRSDRDYQRRDPYRLIRPGGGSGSGRSEDSRAGFPAGTGGCNCQEDCLDAGIAECDQLAGLLPEEYEVVLPTPGCCPAAGGRKTLRLSGNCQMETDEFDCEEYTGVKWVLSFGALWTTLSLTLTADGYDTLVITYRRRTDEWHPLCANAMALDLTAGMPPCTGLSCHVCVKPIAGLVNSLGCDVFLDSFPDQVPKFYRVRGFSTFRSGGLCAHWDQYNREFLLEFGVVDGRGTNCGWTPFEDSPCSQVDTCAASGVFIPPIMQLHPFKTSAPGPGLFLSLPMTYNTCGGIVANSGSIIYFTAETEWDWIGRNTMTRVENDDWVHGAPDTVELEAIY